MVEENSAAQAIEASARWSKGSAAANSHSSMRVGEVAPVRFSALTGVFTPTLLTIFGVIMYVRVGWCVGNAGLLGTWLIMLLAMGITCATALSLSSIATNTPIGRGGPYAVLVRSLGLEVGGSIGVPLYLTRPLGVAMYIIGFREGWLWIFPDHPALVVDLLVFGLLATISYISASLAFRVQYLILAIVVGSLISIFLSPVTLNPVGELNLWGDYPGFLESGFQGTDFWGVFAVFFPATTGILAGANMSGELRDPRRAIPVGTMSAMGISAIVYFVLAWWMTRAGSPAELLNNYTLAIDRALWPPLVIAGLLGATASSALAGLVDGPRILQAMAQNKVVPYSDRVAKLSPDGNPRAAILVTSALAVGIVMMRDLNTIAPFVTMFFLITYCMLNVVVLVETGVSLVSFRPTLRIPQLVPLFGVAGCLASMFIINPAFGISSLVLVFALYIYLQWSGNNTSTDDVRSSVYVSVAQWAASRVTEAQQENVRAWKPNLLVPVEDPEFVRGEYHLLLDLTRPDGSLTMLGIDSGPRYADLQRRLHELSESFRKDGIQSAATVVRARTRVDGLTIALDALQAAFFRPNLLVLQLDGDAERSRALQSILDHIKYARVGVLFVAMHPRAGFGQRKRINMWIQPATGSFDVRAAFASGNLNLNLLTGYRLMRQWGATIEMITVVEDEAQAEEASEFLEQLCELARFPDAAVRSVRVGEFWSVVGETPVADVNILGLPKDPNYARLYRSILIARATCVFVRDSGRESALV